jgi:hypothetical protein
VRLDRAETDVKIACDLLAGPFQGQQPSAAFARGKAVLKRPLEGRAIKSLLK